MTTIVDPRLQNWYKDVENNLIFKVIAIDSKTDTINIQYISGDIGEYDKEVWYASTFDYIEPPEDWSAPYDLEIDDLGYSDTDRHTQIDQENITVSDLLDIAD